MGYYGTQNIGKIILDGEPYYKVYVGEELWWPTNGSAPQEPAVLTEDDKQLATEANEVIDLEEGDN